MKKPQKLLVAPKVGISGGHPKLRGAENGFKTAERNFVKTENFKSIRTGVEKLLKISL